jgi:hypothetical protein
MTPTCASCPYYEFATGNAVDGLCHHHHAAAAEGTRPHRDAGWWCDLHPLFRRTEIVTAIVAALLADAESPYTPADPDLVPDARLVADAILEDA